MTCVILALICSHTGIRQGRTREPETISGKPNCHTEIEMGLKAGNGDTARLISTFILMGWRNGLCMFDAN